MRPLDCRSYVTSHSTMNDSDSSQRWSDTSIVHSQNTLTAGLETENKNSNQYNNTPMHCIFNGHYAITPMQYTAIFYDCKNVHFQMIFYIFLICAQNIDCGYTLEPSH